MSEDKKFTKIASGLLVNVRDLVDWGFETGNTTPEKLRHTVADITQSLPKLIAEGWKKSEIAKHYGLSPSALSYHIGKFQNLNKSVENSKTGSPVTPATATRQANEKKRKAELEASVDTGLKPDIFHGDFRKLSDEIADDSVQLVFTDPPYDKGAITLYSAAAAVSARILKPGGSFIAYSGQRHLPEVLKACSQYLDYWWTVACIHDGSNQLLNKLGIRCGWKPLVWFVKGTRGDVQNILSDTVSGGREKDSHEWQQSESEASYYIEKLTSKDGVVVDFFAGSGTTAAAAKALGRKCIAFEKHAISATDAKVRVI